MSTSIAFATSYPAEMTTAFMSGNGVAGIVVAGIRIVTKLSIPNNDRASSFAYFETGAVIMVVSLILFFLLFKIPFSIACLNGAPAENSTISAETTESSEELACLLESDSENLPSTSDVVKRVFPAAFCLFYVFFVTFVLFPGMFTIIKPKSSSAWGDGWFPILLLSAFMVFDLIGRTAPKWFSFFDAKTLLFPTLLRMGFIPFVIFCVNPRVLSVDFVPFVLISLLALSNGYLSTRAMILGPILAPPKGRGVAGIVMTLALNIGIVGGSFFAVFLLYWETSELPF
eukprot:GCRY01002719.1.p1 GENE.GCRY01002719.1~~GCRY01002719.1.p1  ORF type:complete len:286 (+),score=13.48 GCRY01002719.1:415-1272(+)